jgi:hypothetical protein
MKLRMGFVSNSSASSFIIDWNYYGEETDIRNVYHELLELEAGSDTTQNIALVDELIKNTIILASQHRKMELVTVFDTTIKNSTLDYPESCGRFCAAIMIAPQNTTHFEVRRLREDSMEG